MSRRLRELAVAAIASVAFVRGARANTVTLANGVTGPGATSVSTDDYGSWGFLIGQQFDDEYTPDGVANTFTPTYLTGPELYITTGGSTYSVLLSGTKFWYSFVENPPPTPDGIDGPLTRTVTTAITGNAAQATSGFRVADTAALGIQLDFGLVQSLTYKAADFTSQVDQVYTIKNNGTANTSLVFHLAWDPDLFFNGANKSSDDHIGIGPGVCGVYVHDGDPRWSVALGNGPSSTVPVYGYFGGKEGFIPGAGPAFAPISASIDKQWIWIDKGMPDAWHNYVVGPGVGAVGESDPALVGDATMGLEYRFPLAAGETQVIHIIRHYGTTNVQCFVSAKCGNGVLDPGELCDTTDTADCNGATCSATACGDGHLNTVAGEICDSMGADTAACNGGLCTAPSCGDGYANAMAGELCDDGGDSAACNATCTPATCGDGYVNAVAGEQCDGDDLCDPQCKVTYTLGGGCAGCGAGGDAGGAALLALALLSVRRRRSRRAPAG